MDGGAAWGWRGLQAPGWIGTFLAVRRPQQVLLFEVCRVVGVQFVGGVFVHAEGEDVGDSLPKTERRPVGVAVVQSLDPLLDDLVLYLDAKVRDVARPSLPLFPLRRHEEALRLVSA